MVRMSFAELGVLTRCPLIHRAAEDTPERAMAVADAITRAQFWQECVDVPVACQSQVSFKQRKTPNCFVRRTFVPHCDVRVRDGVGREAASLLV